MRKSWLVASLVLAAGIPALAQQAPQHPELAGIPSARPGIHADRYVFEYFKSAPDAIYNVAKVTIAPGHSIPMHTHSGPEFHYVIAGEADEVMGNDPPRKMKTGEWGYAPEGVPHGLKNTGTEPMTFLAFIVGKKGERLTGPFQHKRSGALQQTCPSGYSPLIDFCISASGDIVLATSQK